MSNMKPWLAIGLHDAACDPTSLTLLHCHVVMFTVTDLLRQSVYSRSAGYEDLNDAERLAADPTTFRLISSQRIIDSCLEETKIYAEPSGNLERLGTMRYSRPAKRATKLLSR
jgi:hypothetical protein